MKSSDGIQDHSHNLRPVWAVVHRLEGDDTKKAKQDLVAAFMRHGMAVEIFLLNEVTGEQFKEAHLRHLHAVVAIGGDGTVRTVANYLVGTDIPLAVIPRGTFNHLSKDMQLPVDIEACLQLIAKRVVTKIDIAEVNGQYFLNNSSIGLYPKAVKHRRRYSYVVKWLAMFFSSLNIFKQYPVFKVRYRFDGQELEVITPLVFISNNEYTLDILNLAERHTLDAGKLYLYINNCRTRFEFLKLLIGILVYKKRKTTGLYWIRPVDECTLYFSKTMLDVAMDGDVFKLETPLAYRIHKQQLTIIKGEIAPP